jgi:16S rRNA processing protein RimM
LNGISKSGWVPLARLLRPQGRRGELLADPLSDLPDIFAANRELFLTAPNAYLPAPNSSPIHIEDHWFPTGKNAGRVVLKLSGCDTISDAETLAGKQLLIAADQLPTLDPDTFFVGDLVGCTVYNATLPIGTIVDIEFATGPDGRTRLEDAAPLLAVQLTLPTPPPANSPDPTETPEPILIPFVRAWLDSVDIPNRRITMHLPEGLLETSGNPGDPSSPRPHRG